MLLLLLTLERALMYREGKGVQRGRKARDKAHMLKMRV